MEDPLRSTYVGKPAEAGAAAREPRMRKSQHVVTNPHGGWSVVSSGSGRASKVFATQQAAVDHARDLARRNGSELFVHGRDGTIRERDSYGKDPHPPKG